MMEETKLDSLNVERVDLVSLPANRRKWVLKKSMNAGDDRSETIGGQDMGENELRQETAEEALVGEELEKAGKKPEDYGYPQPGKKPGKAECEKAIEVLKLAGELPPAILKALADLLEAKKKPGKDEEYPKPEEKPVKKSAEQEEADKREAALKDRVVALEKALRMKDLEPLCKGLGLEADRVWKMEQLDKDMADYFVGKLGEARKQAGQLMKELGTSAEPEGKGEDAFMAEVEKVAKAEKLDTVAAAERVAKERPELWDEHVQARRQAGR